MKIIQFSLLVILPLAGNAQMPPAMDQAQMQQMMEQMQRMQTCMQNIDQSEMEAMEKRARRMETQLKSLCAQGKRDAAQEVAIQYGKEVANNPTMQEMKKCGEHMASMLPQLSIPIPDANDKQAKHHVCDSFE